MTRGSWASLQGNEYQPGALFFFLLPYLLTSFGISTLSAFFLVNAVLLVLHVVVLKHLGGAKAAGIGLLLFLAAGPISYFRFELLVSFLVLVSFLAWLKERPLLSGALLGLAGGVKIYPLFLAPIFLRQSVSPRTPQAVCHFALGCVAGLGFLLTAFWLTGGTGESLVESLRYHIQKPVSVFSVTGGIALLAGSIHGTLPQPVNAYGIHGFLLHESVGLVSALGLLCSLAVVSLATPKGNVSPRERMARSMLLMHVALVSFLVWPTGLQPQYLLWPLAFTALLPVAGLPWWRVLPVVSLHAVVLLTAQILYPVRFDDLLDIMYRRVVAPELLVFLLLGVMALLLLYLEVVRAVKNTWHILPRSFLSFRIDGHHR